MGPDRALEDVLRNLLPPDDSASEEMNIWISTLRTLVETDRWIPALRMLGLHPGVGQRLKELLKELEDAKQKLKATRQQLSLSPSIMITDPDDYSNKVDSLTLIKDGKENMCLWAIDQIIRIPPSHSGHFNNLGCAYTWLEGLDHADETKKAFEKAQQAKDYNPRGAKPAKQAATDNLQVLEKAKKDQKEIDRIQDEIKRILGS